MRHPCRYLDMLKQAKLEGIVVHLTTLWDTYFPGGKEHRLERCSATHIPYLEGDYWPGGQHGRKRRGWSRRETDRAWLGCFAEGKMGRDICVSMSSRRSSPNTLLSFQPCAGEAENLLATIGDGQRQANKNAKVQAAAMAQGSRKSGKVG